MRKKIKGKRGERRIEKNNGVIKEARKLNTRAKIPEEVNTMKRATAQKETASQKQRRKNRKRKVKEADYFLVLTITDS